MAAAAILEKDQTAVNYPIKYSNERTGFKYDLDNMDNFLQSHLGYDANDALRLKRNLKELILRSLRGDDGPGFNRSVFVVAFTEGDVKTAKLIMACVCQRTKLLVINHLLMFVLTQFAIGEHVCDLYNRIRLSLALLGCEDSRYEVLLDTVRLGSLHSI